jgi:hypothetical protein
MKQLEQGIDPGAVTVADRKEERKAPTMKALADEYIVRRGDRSPSPGGYLLESEEGDVNPGRRWVGLIG